MEAQIRIMANMVGTRRKGSKSNSKALNFVPEEPEPLNIINVEAADNPYVELVKNDVLNSDTVPAHIVENEEERMMYEIHDEEEAIGFEINDTTIDGNDAVFTELYTEEVDRMTEERNGEEDATGIEINDITVDGNEAVITELYTEEQDKISDGDDEVTNMGFENSNKKTNDDGSEKDTSDIGDSVSNMAVQNSNEIIIEKETEEDEEFCFPCGSANEDVYSGEEDGEEVEEVELKEYDEEEEMEENEVVEEDEEEIELEEDDEVDVEEEDELEEGEEEGEEGEEEEEEEEEDVSDGGDDFTNGHVENKYERTNEEGTPNTNESLTAPLQVLVENMNENLDSDKEEHAPTPEDPVINEIASTCNATKIVPEKVILLEKGIVRKKLLKKRLVSKVRTSNKVKPHRSEDNEVIGEAIEGDETENLKTKEVKGNIVVKVNKKLNRAMKNKPPGQSGLQIGNVEQNLIKPTYDEPVCMNNHSIDEEIRKEEVKKAKARLLRLNKKKNKKVVDEGTEKVNMVGVGKPESSKSARSSKKIASMGMIFMCSSRTKKDCYRYNILGLPASKKDVVSKIYKGMRLFLYDVDLKMLYGIYKAAGAGGYNIEPEAFKSQFPSQVRFTVLSDCLPLTEEKFKRIIKDNYYTKNKFSCQLTSNQVKNLCKLFQDTTRKSESKGPSLSHRPIAISSTRVDQKRKRAEDSRRVGPSTIPLLEHERKRRCPEEVRHPPRVRTRERVRRSPVIINERRHRRPDVYYDRESYLPHVESSAVYPPLRAEDSRIYSYVRDPVVDSYRRVPAIINYPDLEISGSREMRHHVRQNLHEPYVVSLVTYREPQVYYREPVYESDTRQEHYAEYYRSDDYRTPPTRHHRY